VAILPITNESREIFPSLTPSIAEDVAEIAHSRFAPPLADMASAIDELIAKYPADDVKHWMLTLAMFAIQIVTVEMGVRSSGVRILPLALMSQPRCILIAMEEK